jgi:Skp family chaperone for outer membrane proteins
MKKKRTWLATALVALLTLGITSGIVFARSHAETKLSAAVENGKLTQEQADTKLEHFNDLHSKMTKRFPGKHRIAPEDISAKLADAVENGKLTQEQADTKLETWRDKESQPRKVW